MIHKLKLETDSFPAAQHPDARLATLRMDPDVAAQFRRRGRHRGDGKLIELQFFGEFSNLLAHGHDIRLFIDSDLPGFGGIWRIVGR